MIFLFLLNLVHSITTHTFRIWKTIDPMKFLMMQNSETKNDQYMEYMAIEEFYLNFKDALMGMTLTYLAYFLSKSSHSANTS